MQAASLFTLLGMLIGGGGSDLLDYIPPDAYWKDKQIQVSVETMARELKPPASSDVSSLLDDLNSPDAQVREQAAQKIISTGSAALPQLRQAAHSTTPQIAAQARGIIARIESVSLPSSVRRLMAIRELRVLKSKDGLAVLEPLLKSNEAFVADYAREAIDQIDGKDTRRSHPAGLRDDVWLLPDSCRAVGQMVLPSSPPPSIAQALKNAPLAPGQDRAAMEQGVVNMLVSAAENLGPIRLDAITFGVSGDVSNQSGFVVAIGHGRYNAKAVGQWMHKAGLPSNVVAGVDIYQPPGSETAVFFPSDEYAVFLGGPHGKQLPIEEVVGSIKTRQGKLKNVPEMKKLIESVPADQPLWAEMQVTPAYAIAPVFAPFDTLDLRSQQTGNNLELSASASGQRPQQAKGAVDMINAGAAQGAEQMRQTEQFMPGFKVIGDALRTVKCEATGGNATMQMKIEGYGSGLVLFPLIYMTGQAAPAAQPPANAPPPAPPPPKP